MTEYQTHEAVTRQLYEEVSRLKAVNAALTKAVRRALEAFPTLDEFFNRYVESIGGPYFNEAARIALLAVRELPRIEGALREALEAAQQPAEGTESDLPSDSSTKLAETILSDCGCSSSYTPLLERVAKRIDRHIEALEALRILRAERKSPAVDQEPVALGPLAKRRVFDYIRGSYDLGYNDARNARAVPGDSAPGYKGRDVEVDHGGALFNALRACITAPQPARQPLTSAQIDEIADQHRSQLNGQPYFAWYDYARAVERAHGIGGEA